MRVDVKSAAVVSVVMLIVACASEPKQPAPASAAAPPVATEASADAKPAAAPAVNTSLVRKGYQAMKAKNDEIVYCRSETVTGTKFKRQVCLTEQAIADLERKTDETAESMRKGRTNPGCTPPACGG